MALIGATRYIYFRLSDITEAPVTGRVQSDFAIIFTRDNVTPPDTLTVLEIGSGRYYATYIPTTEGTDYVEIYDAPTDIRVEDVEVIQSPSDYIGASDSVELSQDYPTTAAMTITEVTPPEDYTLYVFKYADWSVGNQASSYAVGQTPLNTNGTWESVIYVVHGTYVVVVRSGSTTVVIESHLAV